MDLSELIGPQTGVTAVVVIIVFAARELLPYFREKKSNGASRVSERLTVIEAKVETLWEVTVLDALKMARGDGLVERNSLEKPTRQFYLLLGDTLAKKVQASTKERVKTLRDPFMAAIEVWNEHKEELVTKAQESDKLDTARIIAVLNALAIAEEDVL